MGSSSSAQGRFFVGDLSACATGRVVTALGKKSLVTIEREEGTIVGAYASANLIRAICAHCMQHGELMPPSEPLPFRLFLVDSWSVKEEVTDRRHALRLIGYNPKKKHEAAGQTQLLRQLAVA